MYIATAGNTVVPAYLTLLAKGYTVTCEPCGDGELWRAEANGDTFLAEDPVLLLGLVTLGEVRGESWKATDEQIDDFMRRFPD